MAPKARRNYFPKAQSKATAGKEDQQGDKKTPQAKEVGLVEGIPMLYYREGKPNNLNEFKEKLSTYLISKYSDCGTFIETGERWFVPEVEPPDQPYDKNNRNIVSLWNVYEHQLKHRSDLMLRREETDTSMWGVIWGQLSRSSIEKLKQHARWDVVEMGMDPFVLWNLIRETHLLSQTGIEFLDHSNALNAYNRVHQGQYESLGDYKKRFELAVEALEAIEHPNIPAEGARVSHFIESLNGNYNEWKRDLMNGIRQGRVEPPANVTAAYRLASSYIRIDGSTTAAGNSELVANAFVTKATNKDSKKANSYRKKSGGDEKKSEDKAVNKCHTCGEAGHWSKDCPYGDKIKKLISEGKIVLVTGHGVANCSSVLLDTEANVHVFCNKELLTNLRPINENGDSSLFIEGIVRGEEIRVTHVGDWGPFKDVLYCSNAVTNVLSWFEVAKTFRIDWDQEQNSVTVVTTEGHEFVFTPRNGLYSYLGVNDANRADEAGGYSMVSTVKNNETVYSQREIAKAKEAKEFLRRLGYPSVQDACNLVNKGGIVNCPVTSRDIIRARNIYGPELGEIKGKLTQSKDQSETLLEPSSVTVRATQQMYVDIMFIHGDPFLISVTMPLKLIQVYNLKTKRHETVIREGLETQLRTLTSFGFKVESIHSDGEGGVAALVDHFMASGISFNPSGPEQHQPVVERQIRVVKERARGIVSVLPFKLPRNWIFWLLTYVVFMINAMPHATALAYAAPRELLIGRKLDFKRDIRFEFGDYVQARVPNLVKNSLSPRSQGGVALAPVGNTRGSIWVYVLDTGKVVMRDKFVRLPMTEEVIRKINSLEAIQSLTFRYRDIEVGDEEPDINGLEDQNPDQVLDGLEEEVIQIPINQQPEPFDEEDYADTASEASTVSVDAVNYEDEAFDFDADGDAIMEDVQTPPAEDLDPVQEPPPQDDTQTTDASTEGVSTHPYRLRNVRSSWKHRFAYRLTARKARKTLGQEATDQAIQAELSQMLAKGVWKPVDVNYLLEEEVTRIIHSSLFLKEKLTMDGEREKIKARFVAGGNEQDREFYGDISSPTVRTDSVLMIAVIAAWERRTVATMDIGGAYLNADMEGPAVHMRINKQVSELLCQLDESYRPFVQTNGTVVVKLLKALYGCVQSSLLWYRHLKSSLESIGFEANAKDECVFNLNRDGYQCTACVHVDDVLLTCSNNYVLDCVILDINNLYKETTVRRGKSLPYLGMLFDFSEPGVAMVSMDQYVSDFLKEYEVSGTASSPATDRLFSIDADSPLLDLTRKDQLRSRVAKVLFSAKRVRPDLLPVVGWLATRVTAPTEQDWDKLWRMLQYVNGTKEFKLRLQVHEELKVILFADASFAVHADGKSHSGIVTTLGEGAVDAESTKQKLVTTSSAESELVTLAGAVMVAIHKKEFLEYQGYQVGPALIYQDNQSAITLARKGKSTSPRTRHVNIRYFFVHDRINSGEVAVEYLSTDEMLADVLTKPLQGGRFKKLRDRLLNRCVEVEAIQE